jgi:hypothetical protein
MKLSAFKTQLSSLDSLNFQLSSGEKVPAHFHITEAGLTTKHFIDCGGTVRLEKSVNFQLYVAGDIEHRLSPQKLMGILAKSAPLFGEEDLEIEVEFQSNTIGKYGLGFDNGTFVLTPTFTDCLAKDNCGIPHQKKQLSLVELQTADACCTPGSGCC